MTDIPKHGHRLLKRKELEDIYGIPNLSEAEKDKVFCLTEQEKSHLSKLHTQNSKFLFILQLGFFKVKKRFYILEQLDQDELSKQYIIERYFKNINPDKISLKVSNPTRLAQQSHILNLLGYRKCAGDIFLLFKEEIRRLSRTHANSSYIVTEILRFLERERIVIPAYSTLQNEIGMSVQSEIERVGKILSEVLSESQKEVLDNLITKQENFLHQLTLLKRDPKDFSLKEIRSTIRMREKLDGCYSYTKQFLSRLQISNKNLLEYARLVTYYNVGKIARMNTTTRRMFLFCFIHVRYKMINDYLVKAFFYRINDYIKDVKKNIIKEFYENRISQTKNNKLGKLILLLIDEMFLPGHLSFDKARKSLFSILNKEELSALGHSLITRSSDEKSLEWEQFDKMGSIIRRNLRPLILALNFEGQPSCNSLLREIDLLKKRLKSGAARTIKINPDLFSKSRYKYICAKKDIVHLRYEFELYRTIEAKITSGDLFFKDSLAYQSFEEDLIEKSYWQKNKKQIIDSLGLPKLKLSPDFLLKNLKEELSSLYERVNSRAITGENTYIKLNAEKGKWTLPYTKPKEPLRIDIFGKIPAIELSTILNLVNRQTRFTDVFAHVLSRYTKKNKNISALFASITACATNIGLNRMGRNANISKEEIRQAYLNFIRPETLKLACDIIADKTKELPSFSNYNLDNKRIYSSSDGQKFGVSRNTSNARYSPKYFGLEKGIVSYTLKANYVPINSRIIGANEHESHFVLDILLDNTSEIRPDVHTTDSHGPNRVNFALLYLFDYVFAPRYKKFQREAKNIYCISGIERYRGNLFQPKRQINTDIIIKEWDNILRVVASLATKTTSQNIIIRKLNAYRRKNNTGKALEELNKIIKTIHILRYIDELEFRQNIQKTLNRGESYHSLKKAIFYDNDRKFRVPSELEQNTWSECTRLIALSIIYYNSFILSQIASRRMKEGKSIDFLKDISPIQWKHVDMYGHFYFGDSPNESEIQELINSIEILNFS